MRSSLTASRSRKRRLHYLKVIVPIVLGAFVIVVGTLGLLSHVNGVELHNVIVSGAEAVSKDDIEETVWQKLSGRYAFIFSRKNTFIFPKRQIAASVLAEFPRLESAKVEFADYHSIRLQVTERDPVALWCGERVGDTVGCFLMDSAGLIFDTAPNFSTGLYVKFYGPISQRVGDTPIRAYFLPEDILRLRAFLSELHGRGLVPEAVLVEGNRDTRVTFENGAAVVFTLPQDFGGLRDDLNAIAVALKEKNQPLTSIEYIDMRFPGKAFYKLRD